MTRSLSHFVAVFGFVIAAHSAEAASPKAPEGEWTVQLKPSPNNTLKGATEAYADTITIKEGKFVTEVNAKYGFEPVACTVKTSRGKTNVVALLEGEKHGKTEYQLTFSVKGKEVSGMMRWGKQGEDGKPKYTEYSVTGTKK
jgi:hypothetical protein